MKHYLLSLLFLILGASVQAQNTYAESVRNYVLEKLIFYYVDDPSSGAPGDMGDIEIDKVAIANGEDIDSPLWTNAANRGLRQLVVKLVRPTSNGGDLRLQRITRDALLLTNKKVIVYLYNDSANDNPDNDWRVSRIYCRYGGSTASLVNKCWPCANYFTNRSLEAGGHMALGAHYFDPSSSSNAAEAATKLSTFLHELVHTQLRNRIESSVPTANRYGAPNTPHFFSEILPSKNTAFNEGVATAFSYRYHHPVSQNMISWLNLNRNLVVDSIAGCSGGATPSYHCLMDRLRAASVPGTTGVANGTINVRRYKIRDVPEDLLLHCETTLANMIFEYTRQYRNPLLLVADLQRARSTIASTSGDNFTFTPLFKEMMKTSLNFRSGAATGADRPRGEIFTMGIVDFYLGYRLDSRAKLERAMGITWSADLPNVDDYFSTHRATLINSRHNNTTWAQIQLSQFGQGLHVHPPTTTPTAGTTSN